MGWTRDRAVGLIHSDPARAYPGYTLFSSIRGDHATLIDLQGCIVHRWHSPGGIVYAHLLASGNLLVRKFPAEDAGGVEKIGMSSSALQELDWESRVVWEYRNPMMHHDHLRLENGNTLVIVWDTLPEGIAERVRGGERHPEDGPGMWGDKVLEVARDGSVVGEWRSWEHLDPEEDIICPLERRREWSHANSLALMPSGELLISFRQISTVGIIDRGTGGFRWKWGRQALSHQHDATPLADGRVLIFDNGSHRRHSPSYSQVIEVDTRTNEIAWTYKTDPLIAFYSFFGSSAERLPNGDTLINEGADGRLFEVTPAGETVWEYVSPFFFSGRFGQTSAIFRAHRYGPDHPALQGRKLYPSRYEELNGLVGRGAVIEPERPLLRGVASGDLRL